MIVSVKDVMTTSPHGATEVDHSWMPCLNCLCWEEVSLPLVTMTAPGSLHKMFPFPLTINMVVGVPQLAIILVHAHSTLEPVGKEFLSQVCILDFRNV